MPEVVKKRALLDAVKLRALLFVLMFVIFGGTAAGFWFVNQGLLTYAEEISHKKVDAEASNSSITSLQKIESELEEYKDVSAKLSQLRGPSELPEFKVVNEVDRIAKQNNIPLGNFSYGSAAGSTPAATTAPATGTGTTTAPTATPAASAGKSIILNASVDSAVKYTDYLQFLSDIEQNIPKLQIKGIQVSNNGTASTTGDTSQTTKVQSGYLNVGAVVIEMYIQ